MINGTEKVPLYKRTFSSLKYPGYRYYFLSLMCEQTAMNVNNTASSLLAYRLTGSAAILGTVALAQAIPWVLLSLMGGVIADRMQKKYVIMAGQGINGIVRLGVFLLLILGYVSKVNTGSWWVLVAASAFQGAVMGLVQPARQSIIPQLVGEGRLMNALSLSSMAQNTLRLFAPALTGFLIEAFDFAPAFGIMAGLYFISMIFMFFVPNVRTAAASGSRNALANINEGLKYIRHEIPILLILINTFAVACLILPYSQLMPIFTEDILKVGARGLGILMSVSGVGALIISIIVSSLPNKKRGLTLLVSTILFALAEVGFSFSASWPLSMTMVFFLGMGTTMGSIMSNTLVQYYVKEEYRGRVMSLYMMQLGMTSFGVFVGGMLANSIGAPWTLGGFAMVIIFLSILMLAFFPKLRRLD